MVKITGKIIKKKRYYVRKYKVEEKQIAGLQVCKKKTIISWD